MYGASNCSLPIACGPKHEQSQVIGTHAMAVRARPTTRDDGIADFLKGRWHVFMNMLYLPSCHGKVLETRLSHNWAPTCPSSLPARAHADETTRKLRHLLR